MWKRWRALSVAPMLMAGAAGFFYLGTAMAPRPDPDGNAPPRLWGPGDDNSPTGKDLDRRTQIYLHRITVKERAVRDLLAARLTLLQAAARFRDVEEEHPITGKPHCAASAPADGERWCRRVMEQAIGWVAANLPAQAADVAARLEAELEQHREPDGTIRLPD
ncbi:MAG TPA: hypothetical protein VKD90_12030 [Gemmataceae bacterium]|nr:hypothetical protein [Gemmataceae bacterium]